MATLRSLGRSASTESTDYSITMGRSVKKKRPKERWLLTRKTWRYMADAGRKLIPEGAQNRPEDVPKIEAYFQEVCRKEPRFLLWRKNSYPGALGFRKKRKDRHKGGSCRKANSEEEVVVVVAERPTHLPLPSLGARMDIQKMKYDFLNKPPSPTDYTPSLESPQEEEGQLIHMLEQFLTISDRPSTHHPPTTINYQDLIDKLQRHLTLVSRNYTAFSNYPAQGHVQFNGDHVQRSLSETLSRYFGQSQNRDKVISDLLTDRKALEKLYFELRRTRGFRGSRGGSEYHPTTFKSSFRLPSRYEGPSVPPPLIECENEATASEILHRELGVQTLPIPESQLQELEERYRKSLETGEEDRSVRPTPNRRRSSVDNDDISQSVSDTIKRYLRMARKKSVDTDKVDRFKRVNYDRNLRNIKAKGEITKPGDDDGLNKGCQTEEEWVLRYRDLRFDEIAECSDGETRSPTSPPSKAHHHHSFLSNLLHGFDKHDRSSTATANTSTSTTSTSTSMQKSKSSSSVMHHGGRLMAKKIFRSRSKSQTRPAPATCSWTPQGGCVWSNLSGKQVQLAPTTLMQLTEVERKVLQKVALAKLQALNLGVSVKVPTENVGAAATVSKPKRRPYLLKRKALTTGIFDTARKEGATDKEGGSSGGLVFGIPLTQCVENDRVSRAAVRTSPFRSRPELGAATEEATIGRHGSRSSFSSLIEAPRGDESGSCESLMLRERIVGSVPGLLDSISCGSTSDLPGATAVHEEEASVPHILNACFKHIEQHGLHTLGIFRVSTSKKRIRQLREDFDCGKETTLDEEQCPHDVATLLKEYLRDLPDPLLCRDLYHAFVHTQKIRNRRLQFEALQHLLQLLPVANRDTLHALLNFLATVAQNASDSKDEAGEPLAGNKMDSNNLATVFAPNILHCIKPGSSKETSADRPEDRIDIINVVRTLIDHCRQLFSISAELLDEIYVHMMDSHPEALDQLLNSKREMADESVEEVDSESYSAPWTPTAPTSEMSIDSAVQESKKTYSREEFLHEAAATGGPNVGMRVRHKDRIRERSSRRRRSPEDGALSTIISRLRGQKDEEPGYAYGKNRSSSLESTSSAHTGDEDSRRKSSPYVLDPSGVITASLTIPVQQHQQPMSLGLALDDDDIPYIEEVENGRLTLGVVRTPTAPPRRRQRSISGSDVQESSDSWPSSPPTSPTTDYHQQPQQKTATRVSFSAGPEQRKDIPKSFSTSTFEVKPEPKHSPSISSIGNAVLRSRTADFERITTKETATTKAKPAQKKYTKRRYTDSRHQTRHIPDSEALETAQKKEDQGPSQTGPVYKRRELISSVPSK